MIAYIDPPSLVFGISSLRISCPPSTINERKCIIKCGYSEALAAYVFVAIRQFLASNLKNESVEGKSRRPNNEYKSDNKGLQNIEHKIFREFYLSHFRTACKQR